MRASGKAFCRHGSYPSLPHYPGHQGPKPGTWHFSTAAIYLWRQSCDLIIGVWQIVLVVEFVFDLKAYLYTRGGPLLTSLKNKIKSQDPQSLTSVVTSFFKAISLHHLK